MNFSSAEVTLLIFMLAILAIALFFFFFTKEK